MSQDLMAIRPPFRRAPRYQVTFVKRFEKKTAMSFLKWLGGGRPRHDDEQSADIVRRHLRRMTAALEDLHHVRMAFHSPKGEGFAGPLLRALGLRD